MIIIFSVYHDILYIESFVIWTDSVRMYVLSCLNCCVISQTHTHTKLKSQMYSLV